MRILHVVTTLDVGGAEMHLLSQVRGQCARGHAVRVLYLKGKGTLAPDFLAAGAELVERVPPNPFGPVRAHLRQAQLVHSHLLKADAFTAVAATLAGKRSRLVSGKHNDEQVLKRPLVGWAHAVLGNLPRRTIALSDHVGRFVQRYGHLRGAGLRRVYYGLDPAPFERARAEDASERAVVRAELGFGADDVLFVCVARFAAQKAHDVLLRAFDLARRERAAGEPALRLLLVGDDPFGDGRQKAEALASELGLGDAVNFAGIRRDVPRLLAASDCFVMCSLWEGLGLVFLEAMACGLPVLATRVSAVPEVVVEGETGVLVPPADERALCDGMLEMAADPARRAVLGAAGAERVRERFGLDRMVDETLAIYAELVPRGPKT